MSSKIFYIDFDTGKLVNEQGEIYRSQPTISYKAFPTWELHFISTAENLPAPVDVSPATAWHAAIDTDFNAETQPMVRTLPEDIDITQATSGIISVPLDSNTETFFNKVNNKQSVNAFFEVRGMDDQAKVIYDYKFRISALGAVDPQGGEPLPVVSGGITAAEVAAMMAGVDEGLEDLSGELSSKQDLITSEAKLGYDLISGAPSIPTKTSDLDNDSGFITENALSSKQDLITAEAKLAYSLLSGTPSIPTKTSDLNNDSGFITSDTLSSKQDLITSEAKLGYDLISGAPTVNNTEIVFTQGGTYKGSITLNQSTSATIDFDAGGGGGGSEISGLEAVVSALSSLLDGFEAVPFVFHPISGDVISSIMLVKDPNYEARLLIIDITFNGSIADSSRRSAAITNHNVTLNSDNIGGLFDSSDSAYLELPSVAGDLSGDFTIEMWVNASDAVTNKALFAAEGDCRIGINIMNGYWSMWAGEGESWNIMQCDDEYGYTPYGRSDTAATLDTWTHIAMVHKETTYTLYVNGTSAKAVTASGNVAIGSAHYLIGAWGNSSDRMFFDGQMKQLKVYNYAKYDSSFTPPTPPQPTPDIPTSGLVFYAPLSAMQTTLDTGQGLMDENSNITYTTSNGIQCARIGAPGSYDASYLSIAPYISEVAPSSDYTVSLWVKVDDEYYGWLFRPSAGTYGDASTGFKLSHYGSGNPIIWDAQGGSGTQMDAVANPDDNTWYHILVTVSSNGTMTNYVNGVSTGSRTVWNAENGYEESTIGANNDHTDGYAYIAAARVYDRVLTQAEITALANEFTPSQS